MIYGRLLAIIQFFCIRGLPTSTNIHVCPLSNYTFVCKHDPQDHKVLQWFMKGYQPYSTFSWRGLSASIVFHVCPFSNYTFVRKHDPHHHNVLVWFREGYPPYSHVLKRASCLNTHSCSLMWFLSHCGILLKQLIVSVMTKYWISWLPRKTPEIYNKNSKWVWSGNTTITNCRQPRGTVRKSRSTITRHQEDKLSKVTKQ